MTWLAEKRQQQGQNDGHWSYSYRFAELQIAASWNLKPSEWDAAGLDDKEEMFAFWRTRRDMEAWENWLQEDRLEKMKPKGKGK